MESNKLWKEDWCDCLGAINVLIDILTKTLQKKKKRKNKNKEKHSVYLKLQLL